MATDSTDPMLVLLAQQGDREALNRLLGTVQVRLFRYICGILANDAAAAEDVLQETLLRIARKLASLNDPRVFDAWAYRIASNETYRSLRRSKRVTTEPLEETLPLPESEPARLDSRELSAVVENLSPGSRAVVILHYQEEWPLEEISTILEIPLGTVKSRLAYGLKRLRERTRR